jgi:hypothetical protein
MHRETGCGKTLAGRRRPRAARDRQQPDEEHRDLLARALADRARICSGS